MERTITLSTFEIHRIMESLQQHVTVTTSISKKAELIALYNKLSATLVR